MADVLEVQTTAVTVTVASPSAATVSATTTTSTVEVSNLRGPQGASAHATIVRPAGEALGGHRVVWLDEGQAKYADAGDVATAAAAIGVTTGAADQDADATIQTYGSLSEPSWSWTPGLPIYLGSAGQLTQTPPAVGAVRQIAIAETTTQIFIDPQPEIRRA
jgi:hypothetical protein